MLRVVFFGAPLFAAKTLNALLEAKVNVVAAVTKPDKPAGRGGSLKAPAVKEAAKNIPVYQPEKASSSEFVEVLKNLNADLFVVVAYGEILKQSVLDIPKKGCINVHASLLPAYRGAAPIQRAIQHGETVTGVTIQHMVLKMDAGEIIKTAKVEIPDDMRASELEEALNKAGIEALLEVILQFEGGEVSSVPQDESKVTFAPKLTPEEAEIDFGRSARQLSQDIRAFYPHPGSWMMVPIKGERKRLKILRAKLFEGMGPPIGEAAAIGKALVVGCIDGALELLEVQLEGKRAVTGAEFLAGWKKF